ncbi:MAG: hypothetical protein EBU66_18525 [Bacteroidetes bacterium]|nr:hypothetical protein [bacterium]NBP66629.1 hypothetical protein [Bacteroidota bacterium]
MEAQGLSEGSLRNSHREIHAVRRKRAPASFQQLAKKVLESCSHETVIRQRLDPERAQAPLKQGTFFALPNEGRGEPGFLIFLPGIPAIYYQIRRRRGTMLYTDVSTLRMRVSQTVSEGGGTVLIATLDDVLHTLRLEDVWMWRGESLTASKTFTQRREKLKEFVEYHWVPDARLLGGIYASVAQPMSMEEFSAKKEWAGTQSIEFIPDTPGRRRMIWYLEKFQKAAEAHAGLKQDRVASAPVELKQDRAALAPVTSIVQKAQKALAVPVDKMPDIYDLYDADNTCIGRGSVQQFNLSLTLRSAAEKGAWVQIQWQPEFNGYEITSIV